jgi:hypothetical protein
MQLKISYVSECGEPHGMNEMSGGILSFLLAHGV